MESAESRLATGHTFARQAMDAAHTAIPQRAEEAGAANPGRAESGSGEAMRAGGLNRMVIASYAKFKGIAEGAGLPGDAEGKKPVPVPPELLIGVNLDVRV